MYNIVTVWTITFESLISKAILFAVDSTEHLFSWAEYAGKSRDRSTKLAYV